jgi:signal transduction histidine kinase
MRGELRDSSVAERIDLAPGLPFVSGNKNQLQQVILNLLHNALEAMRSIPDRRRELQVKTMPRGRDAIIITVQDSGPGIDRSNLNKIFDAFFTTKGHGMGLGLAISRMIVERHGGKLTASSDTETGALFSILLPAALSDEVRTKGVERNPQSSS